MNKIIFIFCFLFGISSFSQIKISGKVTDSIGNPLELANIILIDAETDILESFGTSNEKGEYKIQLRKNKSYNFQVSYIGMATFSKLILSKEEDIVKDVKLNGLRGFLRGQGAGIGKAVVSLTVFHEVRMTLENILIKK